MNPAAILSLISDLYVQVDEWQRRAEVAEAKLAEQDKETPTS